MKTITAFTESRARFNEQCETLHRELGERFYVSPNLKALVEAGKRSYDDEGVAELLTAPESPVVAGASGVVGNNAGHVYMAQQPRLDEAGWH